jgi:hypothetical protein
MRGARTHTEPVAPGQSSAPATTDGVAGTSPERITCQDAVTPQGACTFIHSPPSAVAQRVDRLSVSGW